jgi:serine/threonine-protein kinase
MVAAADIDLRALDLFERLLGYPGNARFRARLLRRERPEVLARLSQLEAAHLARGAMPTELPAWAPAAQPAVPARIGHFKLVARIGQGGMGEVWRAERDDGLFEQVVAIKFMRAHLAADARQAFEAERRILAKLDHPDIVRIIDGGVTGEGQAYLIMEYVEGLAFDEAVLQLCLDQRIRLFQQALETVQFAHGKLIAHADLKPSNVMVDIAGRVRLLDFGIAELLTADRGPSVSKGALTAAFASPQRLAGAPPSIADDVFALGVLLRMIAGEAADADLRAMIAKATAEEEATRYLTVAGFGADLDRWQRRMPVSARPAKLAYVAGKFVARNKRPVVAACLAIMALIATTCVATLASIRAERARAEASARFEDARGTARYLLFTLLDRLEDKPNTLALRSEAAGVAQLYLDRLAHAPHAPPEMLRETAEGYIRLAESQRVPGHPNLDLGAKAQGNLEHAIGLLGAAPAGAAAALAIKARVEDAHLQSYVNNNPDAALALLAEADAIAAKQPSLPKVLAAQIHVWRADALEWKGQYDPALKEARSVLALLGEAEDTESLIARASAIELIAYADGALDRAADSLAGYRRQVDIYQAAYRQNPGSRLLRRQLARARWMLGAGEMSQASAASLAELTTASAELRALAAFDSDDADTPRLADYADADRARLLARLGQLDAALALIRRNLAEEAAQWTRHQTELQWLRDHILDQGLLGEMLVKGGRLPEGCVALTQFRAEMASFGKRRNLANVGFGDAARDATAADVRFCSIRQ